MEQSPNKRFEAILNFTEKRVRELIEEVDENYSIQEVEKIGNKLKFQVINTETGMTGEKVHEIFIRQYRLKHIPERQNDRIQLVTDDEGASFVEIELNQ